MRYAIRFRRRRILAYGLRRQTFVAPNILHVRALKCDEERRGDRGFTDGPGQSKLTDLGRAVLLGVHDLPLELVLPLEAREARPRVGAGADAHAVKPALLLHRLLVYTKQNGNSVNAVYTCSSRMPHNQAQRAQPEHEAPLVTRH